MAEGGEALYRLDGAVAHPSPLTAGPWDPMAQHGSAPTALLTHVVESLPSTQPMDIARLSLDLMRPVPLAPLTIASEIVREGRKIQVAAVTLSAGGQVCVRATALRIRAVPTVIPPAADVPGPDVADPETLPVPPGSERRRGFASALDIRLARGGGPMSAGGPSAVWFRLRGAVVEGAPVSPAMRAAVAADFCNGISSRLPFAAWTFINADLTFNLARPPRGEWVLNDATSWYGDTGAATAFGGLADTAGWIGRCVQSLVVEPR